MTDIKPGQKIALYEDDKAEACEENNGHCETCVLSIETPVGNVCAWDVILENM